MATRFCVVRRGAGERVVAVVGTFARRDVAESCARALAHEIKGTHYDVLEVDDEASGGC